MYAIINNGKLKFSSELKTGYKLYVTKIRPKDGNKYLRKLVETSNYIFVEYVLDK